MAMRKYGKQVVFKAQVLFQRETPALGSWGEVFIQYNENQPKGREKAEELIAQCAEIGFTPVADIPASRRGTKKVFLSKDGSLEYGLWNGTQEQRNMKDLREVFDELRLPFVIVENPFIQDETKEEELAAE